MDNERLYKTMNRSGAFCLAIGIVTAVVGVVCGTLAIITGAGLLKKKSEIMF